MPGLPAPTGVGVPGFGLQHRATISVRREPGSPRGGAPPPCAAGGATALAPGFLEGVAPGAGGLALRLLGELGFFGRGRIFFQAPIPLLPGARGGWALILRGCVCVWGGVLIPAGEAWISFWMQDLAVGGAPGPLPQGPPPRPPLTGPEPPSVPTGGCWCVSGAPAPGGGAPPSLQCPPRAAWSPRGPEPSCLRQQE